MIDIAALPHLNAALNAVAAALLAVGFGLVRAGRKEQHKAVMLAAFAVSSVFLASYLTYHANAPIYLFRGQGGWRAFYYVVLVSHVLLAAVAAPLVLATLWRALKGRFEPHRRWARWTLPIWLYVSVSGIVVYLMLYRFNPSL